jgi:hypothetical protein
MIIAKSTKQTLQMSEWVAMIPAIYTTTDSMPPKDGFTGAE